MAEALRELESLSLGFRRRYLDYEELTLQLQRWAQRYPALAHLESLGRTPEGRELWLLTVGPEPEWRRPAVWIDGNLHAIELAGSSVALAIAEDVLRLHLAEQDAELPAPMRETVSEVLFHIMPRISPDGAEAVLKRGHYVRSVPRDTRAGREQPHWVGSDVDGDGLSLLMRQRDPAGEFVESEEHPGLMLHRELHHAGPFYKLYPEGYIRHYNGRDIPSPRYLSDNAPDLNRNFPHQWAPEHEQTGAGPYPASEPESRAVVEFATRHPNLFAWLNLHTVGGVYIRPPGYHPSEAMEQEDLALYRQLADWAEQLTAYPMVGGYEEFLYRPGQLTHGSLTDYAYSQRGCIALVCELWDLFAQMGIERIQPFVHHYTHITPEAAERMARWDREHNGSRILPGWRPAEHPQIGAVEVGGFDPRFGLVNPPEDRLPEICTQQSRFWLRVAAMAPRIRIEQLRAVPLGGELTRLEAQVVNHGYLPSYILASARRLEWNEPLQAELDLAGAELVAPESPRQELGHLDGWGRGRFGEEAALFDPVSRGSTSRVMRHWTVRGRGHAQLRVGSARTGWISRKLRF